MERYFSKYEDAILTDAIAEALLRTVKDATPIVLQHPEDYEHRAAIMWASSLSHNDLTECGTEKDFACHKLEHELSGLFGVTHGAGLAAIWGSWARYVKDKHLARFEKFARNVMGVEGALAGIEAIEAFFHSIGGDRDAGGQMQSWRQDEHRCDGGADARRYESCLSNS